MTLLPAALRGEHGIVNFHTDLSPTKVHPGVHDHEVLGGELIFWWGEVEREEGVYDWSLVDEAMEYWGSVGKFADIRISTAHLSPNMTPQWLFDTHRVRRVGRGHWQDFEDGGNPGAYALGGSARVARDGARGVLRAGPGVALALGEGADLQEGIEYSVQFEHNAPVGTGGRFVVRSSADPDKAVEFPFEGAGDWRTESIPVRTDGIPSPRFEWIVDGPDDMMFDNLNAIPIVDRPQWRDAVLDGPARTWIRPSEGPVLLRNDSERFVPRQGGSYAFRVGWRADADAILEFRMANAAGAVLKETRWTLAGGGAGEVSEWVGSLSADARDVEFRLVEGGPLDLSVPRWVAASERVACFPNYFDEVFFAKWSRFVAAFADRYRGHPALGRISVGGFGRWEEVMLDEDQYGVLTPQWIAHGYTRERYFAHIRRCMDLYEELFPGHPLRICLAYGLHDEPDVDFTYRRVAAEAARRGIGIKQNGLSELYDTWNENTNGSYLFNRYRHDERINTTYETGAQVYNNGFDAMGGPIALLNRALIDGTDTLFLYGIDIWTRNVAKHLHYYHEQAGRALFTRFYCRTMDASAVNDHAPIRIPYENVWLGLRLVRRMGTEFETLEGERVVRLPRDGARFDLDDRQQHEGMFSNRIAIPHRTEDGAPLEVLFLSQQSRRLESLGLIGEGVARTWVVSELDVPTEWVQSPRNGGEDDHIDLVVRPRGEGAAHLRLVEWDFIPARMWARKVVFGSAPTERVLPVGGIASRTIAIATEEALSGVRIPLHAPGLDENRATGRVFRVEDGRRDLLSEKDMHIFSTGDWLELPFATATGAVVLEVELEVRLGEGGWLLDEAGEPVVEVLAHVLEEDPDEQPLAVAGAVDQTGRRRYFEPMHPHRAELAPGERPLALVRRQQAHEPTPNLRGTEFVSWHGDRLAEWAGAAELVSPDSASFEPCVDTYFNFHLVNPTPAALARLSWRGEGESFSEERSALVPIVPNDHAVRQYSYPLHLEPSLRGRVAQWRFEPAHQAAAGPVPEVRRISFSRKAIAARWDFEHRLSRFHRIGEEGEARIEEGQLQLATGTSGRVAAAPAGGAVNFDAAPGQVLRIAAGVEGEGALLWFKWRPTGAEGGGGARALADDRERRIAIPAAVGFPVVGVPLDHAQWAGHIQLVGLELEGPEGSRAVVDFVEVGNP